MKWTAQAAACLIAVAIAAGGCKGGRNYNTNTGAAPGGGATTGGAETGTMSDTSRMSDTASMKRDTGSMTGRMADTGKRMSHDTAGKSR
jgi:hypothetical protein